MENLILYQTIPLDWSLLIAPGNGNGTFKAAISYFNNDEGRQTLGDFNGDGYEDIAIAGSGAGNGLRVLLRELRWLSSRP